MDDPTAYNTHMNMQVHTKQYYRMLSINTVNFLAIGGVQSVDCVPYKCMVCTCTSSRTVLIRIVAAATINFAPSSVRLLIEGGYYSMCGYYSNKYGMCNQDYYT